MAWGNFIDSLGNFFKPRSIGISSAAALSLFEKLNGLQSDAVGIDNATNKVNSNTAQLDKVLDLIVQSKNLFDVNAVTVGKYMTETGSIYDNAIYGISDYIEVSANTYYVCNEKLRFVAFFDSNKTIISGLTITNAETVISTPTNTVFMVVTLYANDYDFNTVQIEEGTEITPFEEYGYGYQPNLFNILNSAIPNSSVSIDSLNFVEIGKNKFNKDAGTDNFYISTIGNISASSVYGYSEYIPVIENTEYFTNKLLRFVTFYDSQKILISSLGLGDVYEEAPKPNTSFVVPSGVAYMIVSYQIADKDELQLEIGTTLTKYQSYCYNYKGIPIRENTENANVGIATIAPIQYICSNKETNFYNENVLRDAKKYLGQTDITLSITPTRWKNTSISNKLIDATSLSGLYGGNIRVANEDFILVLDKEFQISVSDMTKNNAITIGNIGDSYSGRMTWAKNILNETIPSQNLNFVGVRNANTAPIKCDAQGGYAINSWFTVDNAGNLNQFMHPVNDYLYYGLTSFWIDANSVSPTYGGGYFDDAKLLFDSVTGLKLSPNLNDVMNQGTKDVPDYIVWNGSAWVTIDEVTLGGFEFNFAKYRTAWNIPSIDLLHVLLGTNDFAGSSVYNFDTKYADFKTKYEQLIASVHADLPNCKIVVGVPPSRGKQGKYGTIDTERGKLAMWMCAEKMHQDFANRESEHIYLLDYHTQVDRVYGYDSIIEEPFAEYDGTLTDDESLIKTDYIHLGQDGFDQMGLAYMAIIQELR
jgi:hypothetical protein